MLELKNIHKQFQERIIINDLSLTFPDHGLIGIQGESGCGKSTLLYIIGMLDSEFEGEVFVNGEKVNDEKQYIKEHISYMMQNKDYIDSLTVKENIVLAAQVSGTYYTNNQLRKLTHQLGIDEYLNQYPNQLSGGQLKRVSIAKALLKKSNIVLCDEPTGTLQAKQADEVMALLKKISQEVLIIVVSHDPELLSQYCDTVLTLKDGHIEGNMIQNDNKNNNVPKKRKYSLLHYPIRQLIFQKHKLITLFIFQWLVIMAFFLIVTAINGVFEAIERSEKTAPYLNMMTIEKKTNENFSSLISHQNIVDIDYQYDLENLCISQDHQDISSLILFLPKQRNHIALKRGRFPSQKNEVLVTQSLYDDLKSQEKLHVQYFDYQTDFKIVGILQDDFFTAHEIYCSPMLKKELSMLKNENYLLVESQYDCARALYNELSKTYYTYCDVIERINNYQSLLSLARFIAYVFIGISLLISLLLIGIVESIIYHERKHDVSYLLSLGMTKRTLLGLSLIEAMILGIIIAVGGCAFCMVVYYYVNSVYQIKSFFHFQLKLQPLFFNQYDLYVIIGVCYMIMGIIGVIKPLLKMMKLNKIDILREE